MPFPYGIAISKKWILLFCQGTKISLWSYYSSVCLAFWHSLSGFAIWLNKVVWLIGLQLDIFQAAVYSWFFFSWYTWNHDWCASDHNNCHMQEPIHAHQRMESVVSRSHRQRGTISRDRLCAICWSCYTPLAISSYRSSCSLHHGKFSSRCICSCCCLSGLICLLDHYI